MLEPLPDIPILFLNRKTIVLADLHLGIEYELMKNGINISSQTERLLKKIITIIDDFAPKDVIFLGDIKHNVPYTSKQEKKEIPDFFLEISNYSDVYIVKGNHDGNLEDLIPNRENIFLYDGRGFSYHGFGLFHGHAYPFNDVLDCKTGIMAHIHPMIRLTDDLGISNILPIWLRVPINKKDKFAMNELVVIPAFNDLCGGLAINIMKSRSFGFLESIFSIKKVRAYLLDGTDLGFII